MGLRNRSLFNHEVCFFITTTCHQKLPLISLSECQYLLKESLAFVNDKFNAHVLGYVFMPNHIHMILYFSSKNHLSDYMRDFKKFTSTKIRQRLDQKGECETLQKLKCNEASRAYQVWTNRFDDVFLRNKRLLEIKLNYIHCNPLQSHWNLVKSPKHYQWSSAAYYDLGSEDKLVTDYRVFF